MMEELLANEANHTPETHDGVPGASGGSTCAGRTLWASVTRRRIGGVDEQCNYGIANDYR